MTDSYHGPERRQRLHVTDTQFDDLAERLAATGALMQIQRDLEVNTAKTAEIYEVLSAARGAFQVLEVIGRLARPLAAVAMLATAAWSLWQAVTHPGGKP